MLANFRRPIFIRFPEDLHHGGLGGGKNEFLLVAFSHRIDLAGGAAPPLNNNATDSPPPRKWNSFFLRQRPDSLGLDFAAEPGAGE
jgi:hypothetical protein